MNRIDAMTVQAAVPPSDLTCPRCGNDKDIKYHPLESSCRVCRPNGRTNTFGERIDHLHYQCPCGARWAGVGDPVHAEVADA